MEFYLLIMLSILSCFSSCLATEVEEKIIEERLFAKKWNRELDGKQLLEDLKNHMQKFINREGEVGANLKNILDLCEGTSLDRCNSMHFKKITKLRDIYLDKYYPPLVECVEYCEKLQYDFCKNHLSVLIDNARTRIPAEYTKHILGFGKEIIDTYEPPKVEKNDKTIVDIRKEMERLLPDDKAMAEGAGSYMVNVMGDSFINWKKFKVGWMDALVIFSDLIEMPCKSLKDAFVDVEFISDHFIRYFNEYLFPKYEWLIYSHICKKLHKQGLLSMAAAGVVSEKVRRLKENRHPKSKKIGVIIKMLDKYRAEQFKQSNQMKDS